MEPFVAYYSRWRLLLLAAGALGFVAAGLWIAGFLGNPPKPGHEWLGWLCSGFFGLCALSSVRRLSDAGEQVRIDGMGIIARAWSDDLIPWSEITRVTVWKHRSQKMIILHLATPARFPGKGLAGRMAGANRALTGGDVAITLTGMDHGFKAAMAAIGRHRPMLVA